MAPKVVHLVSRLEVGGLERAALRLAARGRRKGSDHSLLLFDKPFRSSALDFCPGDVPVHFIQRGTGIDFRFAVNIARCLAENNFAIVHAHNATAIFYSALAVLIARRPISVIGTFGTRPTHATAGARFLTRWASGRIAQTVAKSDELTYWLLTKKWVRRCTTIPNGVDLTLFSPEGSTGGWREKMHIPQRAILVGHVGRFDSIKRHRDMITAAASSQHDISCIPCLCGIWAVICKNAGRGI